MKIIASGLLSRAEPGTDRANLTFPTVTRLSDGVLLATGRAGPDKDSEREFIELYHSDDDGKTWSAPTSSFTAPEIGGRAGSLKLCYLTELSPGRVLAASMWVDRSSYPGRPLFNGETEGCLPMAILLAESGDGGQSWSPWRHITLPEDLGPPSLTSPILKLGDGRLAMSIETNKPYEDASKWMQKAVFLYSSDEGKTWSTPAPVAEDISGRIFNWDLRCAVAPDGRIATFAWTYDTVARKYLNIHRRVSSDNGATWSTPSDIGVSDQAARPAILSDGRTLLAWVDRFGSQSIRARLAPALDVPFDPASEVVISSNARSRSEGTGNTGDLLVEMEMWNFGLPYAEPLPNGEALVVYYAGDNRAMDLHWARLRP